MEKSLENKLQELQERIIELESSLPDTALLDHSFLKRAFTVFGHNLVANLIVSIPFVILFQYFMIKFMPNIY